MKGLNRQQRNYYSDFCAKFSLMSAVGLIFGQFVPDQEPSSLVVIVGIVLTAAVIIYGGYLQNLSNN